MPRPNDASTNQDAILVDVSQTRVGLGRPCPYLEAAEGDSHDTAEVGTDIQIDGSGNSR
jgi:hypothetical protein